MQTSPSQSAITDWVVISLGHRFRGDDGVGPYLLERLRSREDCAVTCIENTGDMTRLLEDWRGRRVCLVDAVCDDTREVGEILWLDGLAEALPDSASTTSSHGLNLGEALALGRIMDALPLELRICAICGGNFSSSTELSPPVARAVAGAEQKILQHLIAQTGGPPCTNNP
ncbi:hydrogenase maturation protease [Microbulbifer hydrolyticus]|uniref:Hydrogenase maturation protease n=1 Tax=Microbulbifer hydrolyticus TaxID=48074 RepID=A0A6P1TBR5_9GAMM|nr:hydrogenase maturation protease [Microbulbifer hydrolyticus]MBB5210423.1 hydrogenase maturation protease [Microbulbifer hydrolyticus]QHQ39093.1 hydrogenase maturation protease [Microbulbifer hydrolyticus]